MENIKFAIKFLADNSHKMVQEGNNYAVQSVNLAIEALEKQIPKKLKLKESGVCVCPSCGELYMYSQYCDCGQKLDMDSVR